MTTKPLKFKSAFVIPELGPPIIQDGFLIHCAHRAMVPMDFLREHLDPKNRNSHPSDQVDELVEQYKFQGIRHPIIVSTLSGIVKAGDGRFQAAERAGMTAFPVDFQPWDNEDQEYAFGIADNAIQAWSVLDLAGINLDLSSLDGMTLDIDRLAIRGFEIEMADKEGEGDPDEVPEPKPAIVKRGEIYVLGSHRLMCGDSTCQVDVATLMNNEKADVCFTSPPYNAGCFGYDDGKSKYKKKGDDDMNQDDYLKFLIAFTDAALSASNLCLVNNQFLSGNRHALGSYLGHYAKLIKEVFPWIKNTAPPNVNKGVFTNRFEFFVCLEKDNAKKDFPVQWQGKFHNVIEGSSAASENEVPDSHGATMPMYVPLWFFERLPYISAVFEPFCGSGTTLIACEKTNRRCFGMEIDPIYCGVILDRWAKFTGLDPHREDGIAWSEIKANLVS